MHTPRPTWLGWLALLILIIGGSVAYLLSTQEANPDAHQQMVFTIALTVALVGICLICLSADWWLRR